MKHIYGLANYKDKITGALLLSSFHKNFDLFQV